MELTSFFSIDSPFLLSEPLQVHEKSLHSPIAETPWYHRPYPRSNRIKLLQTEHSAIRHQSPNIRNRGVPCIVVRPHSEPAVGFPQCSCHFLSQVTLHHLDIGSFEVLTHACATTNASPEERVGPRELLPLPPFFSSALSSDSFFFFFLVEVLFPSFAEWVPRFFCGGLAVEGFCVVCFLEAIFRTCSFTGEAATFKRIENSNLTNNDIPWLVSQNQRIRHYPSGSRRRRQPPSRQDCRQKGWTRLLNSWLQVNSFFCAFFVVGGGSISKVFACISGSERCPTFFHKTVVGRCNRGGGIVGKIGSWTEDANIKYAFTKNIYAG